MGTIEKIEKAEPWRRRLYIPFYKIGESAQYARTNVQTVRRWHQSSVLTEREQRSDLSYMQLIEVGVVAAMRSQGVKLKAIRDTRAYASDILKSEYPFAEYKFKKDGKHLILEYEQIDEKVKDKLLYTSRGGQLGWKEILGQRLEEFEYENEKIAIKWHVAGRKSSVIIDPRISFGSPNVHGCATWAIVGRWNAGESIADIAEDFGLEQESVVDALKFEGFEPDYSRQNLWAH